MKKHTKKMPKKRRMSAVIRSYRDTIFRMIFKNKRELLVLYNAVNGTHYTNLDDLQITTLENAIYMNMKNDVSCMLDMRMNLYEHQSTVNPNMPLRDLFYIARLSDSFEVSGEVNLELTAVQLNINPGYNEELKKGCPTLYQYVCYVEKVRKNKETMPIDVAVKKAVDDCIKEDILKEFLLKNKSEMIQVSIFEYDEEKHKKFLREEGFEDGLERGRAEAIIELLEEMGDVSDALREAILSEKDISVLKKWNKLVAKADSIEDFLKVINYNN